MSERKAGTFKIDTILKTIGFDAALSGAELVITGEGAIDSQSLMGKATVGVLEHAKRHGIPVIAIAGRVEDRPALLDAGFADVIQIERQTGSHTENLRLTAMHACSGLIP